jgi:5-methylcytosine-specific restriction protein A
MTPRRNPSPSGWAQRPTQRHGARRLPEKLRKRVLARYPQCWLAHPGRCTGVSSEVHHVIRAADFLPDDPNIDAEFLPDGRPQLVGVCEPCHRHETNLQASDWKRKPEAHPGILRDDEM